jgi:hypothetical protein
MSLWTGMLVWWPILNQDRSSAMVSAPDRSLQGGLMAGTKGLPLV